MSGLAFLIFFIFHLSLGRVGQYSPGSKAFWRGLDRMAASTEIVKSVPDLSGWRTQRLKTVDALKRLGEAHDTICVRASYGKAAGSGIGILCGLTSLAGVASGLLGVLPALPAWSTSAVLCPSGFVLGEVSAITESILSAKYLNVVQAVLMEDRKLSRSLDEWLKFSPDIEKEVERTFGFDLKSKNAMFFVLLNEFSRLFSVTQNFKEALNLMKSGKYSSNIGKDISIDDLWFLSEKLRASPQVSDKIRKCLSILSTSISAVEYIGIGFEMYRKLRGEKVSSLVLYVQDKLNIKIHRYAKISANVLVNVLDIAANVITFTDAANIIKDGKCPSSDSLKRITDLLESELHSIDSLFLK